MTPGPAAPSRSREGAFYLWTGLAALLLSTLPYVWAWLRTPPGHVYSGLLHNIDDGAVYLSWMRQVAEGNFFQSNRFCVEPQKSVLFNVWFLVLGTLSRWLPPILVFHLGRLAGGAALLWAVARLAREALGTERSRRLGYALCCFGAGLGWLFGGFDPSRGFDRQPIDLFQPEAVTFLTLHYSPLFAPATAAMALFLAAFLRAERTGRLADVAPAALCGALLGNFHSYDVLHVFAAAAAFRVATDIARRRFDLAGWVRLAVVGAAALPTTGWVFWAFRVDPLFNARAHTRTFTAPLPWVLLGLGLPVPLALWGAARGDAPADGRRFLGAWAVAALAVAYLPFEFQRKMLMGIHIPVALLAGAGLDALTRRLSGDFPKIAAGAVLLLCAPSNALFVQQEVARLADNAGSTQYRPYLTRAEIDAMAWLRANTRPTEAVLVSPDPTSHLRFPFAGLLPHLAVYVPALAGNVVYNGHWSETIAYEEKLGRANRFFQAGVDDATRRSLLAEAGIRWVLYDRRLAEGPLRGADGQPLTDPSGAPRFVPVAWPRDLPTYLRPRYENTEIVLYEFAP